MVFVEAEALAGWTIRVGGWLELPPQPMSNPPIRNCRRQHEEMFHALQSTIFRIHICGNRHVFDVGDLYVQEPE